MVQLTSLLKSDGQGALQITTPLRKCTVALGALVLLQILDGTGVLDQGGLGESSIHDSQAKGHARGVIDTSRQSNDRVSSLSSDFNALSDIGGHKETVESHVALLQSSIDTLLAGSALAELQSLEVGLVHDTLGLEGSEKAVLARAEGRVDTGQTTLGAVVIDVVLDKVLNGADVSVLDLGQVVAQVVVEVNLDVGVRRLVRVAAGGAVVPVPAIRRDNLLVVGQLGAVDDGGAGGLNQLNQVKELGDLVGITEGPEGLPGDTEYGALKSGLVGQELGVTTDRGETLLGGGVVIAGVNAVDGIEGIDGITDGLTEGADGILVGRLRDDTGTGGQTNSGLDANDGVALSGVNDTAVGLGSESNRHKVGADSNTRASAATTGVNGEVVSTAALAPTGAEAFGVVVGAHVGPLAQSSLAKKQSTSLAHSVDNIRITGHNVA